MVICKAGKTFSSTDGSKHHHLLGTPLLANRHNSMQGVGCSYTGVNHKGNVARLITRKAVVVLNGEVGDLRAEHTNVVNHGSGDKIQNTISHHKSSSKNRDNGNIVRNFRSSEFCVHGGGNDLLSGVDVAGSLKVNDNIVNNKQSTDNTKKRKISQIDLPHNPSRKRSP
jgi:hypothetical protein